jgi:tetratricopeptide (TPR) repeat protein/TolB-like protein
VPPSPGMRFSRFELVSRIGAGGMGEVWSARDQDLHRDVAVKFLPERFAADPGRLQRFEKEARAASSLNHPNIVTIHEIGETSGLPYIVMELVQGHTLRELIQAQEGRPFSTRRLLDIAAQLADGLAKAHAAGIVHRDLKPENVMVTADAFVKILDFGLAKLRSDSSGREQWFDSAVPTWPEPPSPQTAVGAVLGTAGYMSPEQARGRVVDHRSDQFTFGAILYEMATGRPAFRRETTAQTIAAIIDSTPEALATLNPQLPVPLRWVIEGRCLAKEPAERYVATQDLARELRDMRERLSASDAASSSPPAGPQGTVSWRRAARAPAAVLLALAFFWGVRSLWKGAWDGAKSPAERSQVVAVLPLTNLTGDAQYDATAAGIVQVVVDSLSQVDGLEVLPRASTVAFADRKSDLTGIARALDASYIVDGMLQRSENRLRVSLSLVRASSKTVEWGETFDGAFPAVFDLQSRVADGVAHAARLRVSPEERVRIEARATASPSAWQDYTTALALLDRQDRPGNAAAAIARLEEALRADPRFATAHAALARACLARYEETKDAAWADRGRDAAQEALRLDPRDVEVRRSLARILASRGRLTEAVDELKQAVALKPNSDGTRRLFSEVLIEAGQPEAALEQARRAVEIRPSYAENQMALGWVRFSTGRFGDAAAAYRRATEAQPDNAWAFQMLGTSLHAAGDLAGAVAPYKEAIRLAPESRAWANLGFVYYATGRLPEAVHAYEEAARLEPRSGTIRRDLGDAHARSGDRPAARADWKAAIDMSREALRVNPRDARQLTNLAICLAKLGQSDAARQAARQAVEAGPSSADTHYGAAVVHALTGDAPGALDLLEKAFALGASVSLARDDDDLASLRSRPKFKQLLERAASPAKEVTRAS